MGVITSNPSISLQANIGAPLIYYFADGAALFGCIGNPEGVIPANKRSIAVSDNGSVYIKTTDLVNTGWIAIGGGGGSGTVTSIALAGNAIFDFSGSSANPITTNGIFDIDFATQTPNKIFASPSSGAPAKPTFRTLTSADLSLAAPPPSGGVPFNDGTNAFTAVNGFKFDSASNTLQVGESTVLKGTVQLFAALSAGSVKHTVNNPPSNYVWIWGDSLPANNDLLKVTVSGNNVTIASIAASALGFAAVNPTSTVLPYNNSGVFADSPIRRLSASAIGSGTASTDWALVLNTLTGNLAITTGNSLTVGGGLAVRQLQFIAALNNSSAPTISMAESSGGTIIGCNALQIGWSDNANGAGVGAATVGFTWRASGVTRVSNGGTGTGKLGVGTSVMTTANQFSVDSQSTSVIAGFFSMPNGSSVPTIQGVTNSIQSFAFNPSGKLQGGCNIPTSNQQFSAIGNMKSDVSEVGNSGGTNTNALSFTVPANSIANNGDTVEFTTTVIFAGNANNKQVDCQFAGTSVFLITSAAYNGSQGQIRIRIKRTGATTAKVIGTLIMSDVLLKSDCQYIDSLAVTWSTNNTFQVKLQGVTNSDLINKELESNVIIAQTS